MPTQTTPQFDPTDGTTPVTLPTQDPCCQSPCDPPWRTGPSCIQFHETKTLVVPIAGSPATGDFGRGAITINVTYAHTLCLTAKQRGPLAYTLTLLPGEKMTLYQSDRYRRTTSETERFSVQTTFSQFVSAVHQQQNSSNSSALLQVLNSQTHSSNAGGGGGINLGIFSIGGSGGESSSSSSTSVSDLSVQNSASQFQSVAQQASQYTDLQRSITISTFEDAESVSTTQRTLVNSNTCYAVTYFVRKVLDVYVLTTKVLSVTFRVTVDNFVSPVLTPAQINQLPQQYQKAAEAALKGVPAVGDSVEQASVLTVPTDGVVYDPELAHCCAQDPALDLAERIKLERAQAEAQKLGLEIQLMALEVQRRQALLAAGTLTPFLQLPSETTAA